MRPVLNLIPASSNSLKLFKNERLRGNRFNRLLPEYASGHFFLSNVADCVSVQVSTHRARPRTGLMIHFLVLL